VNLRQKLSDQLRDAVRGCRASRYALAKQLGIAESALSRFVSGDRGLTLETVDKLAEALGLRLVSTIEMVPRPSPRGRRRKETNMTVKSKPTKVNYESIALAFARDANENNFSSRRGVLPIEGGLVCIYNNNPYNDPQVRERETAQFRRWLRSQGIKELAYATYPPTGEDAGYTYAMILRAEEEAVGPVAKAMNDIVAKSMARLLALDREAVANRKQAK
jgi:transcriptional regulator with XRE-family HTH domain